MDQEPIQCDLQTPGEPSSEPEGERWRIEAVLRLGIGLMLGFSLFSLLSIWLYQDRSETAESRSESLSVLLSTLAFQVLVLALVHVFLRQHLVSWGEFLGIRDRRWPKAVWQGLLIGWGALPPALALKTLVAQAMIWLGLTPQEQMPVEILQETTEWGPFLGFGLTAVVVAPVVEEILFRGILYTLLKQRGFAVSAAWISAVLFAGIHFNQVTFIPLVFLALCLAWIYDYTGSLLAPILAHAFFNGVNFLVLLLQMIAPASPGAS